MHTIRTRTFLDERTNNRILIIGRDRPAHELSAYTVGRTWVRVIYCRIYYRAIY